MSTISKFSEDSSIKLPKYIIGKSGLKPGAEIIWLYDEQGKISLMEKPKDFAKAMKGLGKEIWNKTNVDKYIEEERKPWE